MAGRVVVAKAAKEVAKKTGRRRRVLRAPLKISEPAADQIKEILCGRDDAFGVRLGVRTRGCNGLSYTLNFVDQPELTDEIVEEHGVKICIEPKALFHIVGTTMDWEETAIQSQFVFLNPNATAACGCGESFSTGEGPPPGMPGMFAAGGGGT